MERAEIQVTRVDYKSTRLHKSFLVIETKIITPSDTLDNDI